MAAAAFLFLLGTVSLRYGIFSEEFVWHPFGYSPWQWWKPSSRHPALELEHFDSPRSETTVKAKEETISVALAENPPVAAGSSARSPEPPPPPIARRSLPVSIPFAVVDVQRILQAYSPPLQSQEDRREALEEIQRALRACLSVHSFAFVFDSSGETLNGTPFVLNARGAVDLTDEVLRELGSSSTLLGRDIAVQR